MSVYFNIVKQNGPITLEELQAIPRTVPHYEVRQVEGGTMVGVPMGPLGMAWLDYSDETGALWLQLLPGQSESFETILNALRRLASCIPDAVVECEGETFGPLPWDRP